jgi:hypothetical protein
MKHALCWWCVAVGIWTVGACTSGVPAADAFDPGTCRIGTAQVPDTLFVIEETFEFPLPRDRSRNLAPYPPAAGGENRIRFQGELYYAWGMPAGVGYAGSPDRMLIRIGTAGEVPIFASADRTGTEIPPVIHAPITEDCVFLPFKHVSEMM